MLYVRKLFSIERRRVTAFVCPQSNMALTGEPSKTHKHKFPRTFQTLDELILSGAFLVIKVMPNLSGNDSDFHNHKGTPSEAEFLTFPSLVDGLLVGIGLVFYSANLSFGFNFLYHPHSCAQNIMPLSFAFGHHFPLAWLAIIQHFSSG